MYTVLPTGAPGLPSPEKYPGHIKGPEQTTSDGMAFILVSLLAASASFSGPIVILFPQMSCSAIPRSRLLENKHYFHSPEKLPVESGYNALRTCGAEV